jgi:hypothetical protein
VIVEAGAGKIREVALAGHADEAPGEDLAGDDGAGVGVDAGLLIFDF